MSYKDKKGKLYTQKTGEGLVKVGEETGGRCPLGQRLLMATKAEEEAPGDSERSQPHPHPDF